MRSYSCQHDQRFGLNGACIAFYFAWCDWCFCFGCLRNSALRRILPRIPRYFYLLLESR